MLIKRLLANIIDMIIFFALVILFFLYVVPPFIEWQGTYELSTLWAFVSVVIVVMAYVGLQYPFMQNHQTLGKAFFGLYITSTNDSRPLSISIIVQREFFAKIMTAYLMCLPVFIGKEGKHDHACQTKIVSKR